MDSQKFKNNSYQYTRGVRFCGKLEKQSKEFNHIVKLTKESKHKGQNHILSELTNLLFDIQKELTSLLFDSSNAEKEQLKASSIVNNRSNMKQEELQNFTKTPSFLDHKSDKLVWQRKLSVNKAWLKNHHKDIFYLLIRNYNSHKGHNVTHKNLHKNSNSQGKYALKDLKNLHPYLIKWLAEWDKHREEIKKSSENKKHEFSRRSDIAEHVRGLLNRKKLAYINEFLTEAHTTEPYLDMKIEELKNSLKNLEKKLKTAERIYLLSQFSGVEIAKASLNYCAIDKKPKEYYEDKISCIHQELYSLDREPSSYHHSSKKSIIFFSIITPETDEKNNTYYKWILAPICNNNHTKNQDIQKSKTNQGQEIFCFKSKQEKEWIKKICKKCYHRKTKNEPIKNWNKTFCSNCKRSKNTKEKLEVNSSQKDNIFLSLHQTYTAMKVFKAEQKTIFYEVITHIANKKNSNYKVNNLNHVLYGYEFSHKELTFEYINNQFSLFKFTNKVPYNIKQIILDLYKNEKNKVTADKVYTAFVDLIKNIQRSKNRNNQRIFNNKQKRGFFLFGKNCYFKEYGDFCEKYKNIAQKKGYLIAQIKGVEKEQQESQQTAFWGLIYCDKDQKNQLWLVPKEKRKEAQDFIYSSSERQQKAVLNNEAYLCCFESLTMRALHKLCFAEQSSFIEEMEKEYQSLKELQKDAKQFSTNGDKENIKQKDQKKLIFFKKLLKSDYAHKKLKLNNFDFQWLDQIDDIDVFEKSLENACYYVKKTIFTEQEKQDFLKKFDVTVLDISSYDLEGRNKNTHQSPVSLDRLHTNWWKIFWGEISSNNMFFEKIRLNPEIKIRYRKLDENLKKYFEAKNFPSKFKNRKLQEQFTVNFTLSLNAGKKYDDLAFAKPEELLEKINQFNQKLNQQMDFKIVWKYGIDRGQIDLATLCLVKFEPEKETYKENGKNIVKPIFPNKEQVIKCYTLKDYTVEGCIRCGALKKEGHKKNCPFVKCENSKKQGWKYIIKNISYFVNEEHTNKPELFKTHNISCLDLTTAKVIKQKIITNGDIMTYLKLKKVVSKRELCELYQMGKIQKEAKLEWSEWENGNTSNCDRNRPDGVLNIKTSEGEKTIYWYCKKYENIPMPGQNNIKYNKENILNTLNSYLNQLRHGDDKHNPPILKVNHLRDSITANMVGVICYLQNQYPGFVILEDLSQESIDRHFFKGNANISRRLENALYNKFQSLGLVPPHVKNIIHLRENIREIQKNDTSKNIHKNKQKQPEKSRSKTVNRETSNVIRKQFQSLGMLPSSEIKDENLTLNSIQPVQSSQVGAIIFVDETNTSQSCPYCEQKQDKSKKQKNMEKYQQHRFICGDKHSCGFDTYYFKPEHERSENHTPKVDESKYKKQFEILKYINDNDKVAAYNIAKKITNPEQIGKMKLLKKD